MDFSKITKDITNEYVELTGKTDLSQSDMNVINSTLFDYLKSYYFKDLYFAVHMRTTEDGYKVPCLLKNSNLSNTIVDIDGESINIKNISDFNKLDRADLTYFDIQKAERNIGLGPKINIEEISTKGLMLSTNDDSSLKSDIITNLKNKDAFYEIVFEKNPIKQMLNLKNRLDITISKIDCEGLNQREIHARLTEFNHTTDKNTVRLLTDNYALKYLSTIKHAKSIYIAHNNHEIAGILLTDINYHLKSVGVQDYKKFDYVEAISVGKSFTGLGIGSKLYEQLVTDMNLTNGVIIMSRFTENGSNYLANKFDEINKRNPNALVIQDDEKEGYAYALIETLFKNTSSNFYHRNKQTELPQVERSFEDSLQLLKNNISLMKVMNQRDIEATINTLMDSSIAKQKQTLKIKPQ
jgi:hypothetical protein